MDVVLQVWGGSFYLLNKILFSLSEGRKEHIQKQLRITGWVIYILGVPAWAILLVGHDNWIAASLEVGAIPAMILGLYNTYRDHKVNHRALNMLATLCTYGALSFGVIYSLMLFGGIISITQVLEICAMIGFLLGSYFLAKNNVNGWLLFMVMNLSMASLMYLQDKPILVIQQGLSFCFVCYGYFKASVTQIREINTQRMERGTTNTVK